MTDIKLDRRTMGAGLAALAGWAAGGSGAAAQDAAPQAVTRYGRVRGFRRNGAEIYLGMPYGASTAGERRFLPPVPPAAWTEVRDATRLGQRAPQPQDTIYGNPVFGQYLSGGRAQELIALQEPMGEDCLVLNVLTPRADRQGRPVLVYLHGGGFQTNSGATISLGDRLVMEEDVVLVTVNHRLANLGFLYLGGLSPRYAQGNPGLLDLVAALQWVRDNIGNFGGDPAKVTIFGDSGGGGKVGMMMAMPQAKGLFRAAIMESAAFLDTVPAEQATQTATALLARLSISPSDLSALHSLPYASFLGGGGRGGAGQPAPQAPPARPRRGPGLDVAATDKHAVAVADGRTLSGAVWTQGAPALAAGIPLIVGNCMDEETVFTGLRDPSLFQLDWPQVPVRLSQSLKISQAALEPCIAAYRETFSGEGPADIYFRMMNCGGEHLGRIGRDIADAKAAQAAPVYYYRNEFDTRLPPGMRAFHTSELPLACRLVADPRAEKLSRQIAGAWAAFARTGHDPNHPGLPRWERYRAGGTPVMVFDSESRLLSADPGERPFAMLRAALGA